MQVQELTCFGVRAGEGNRALVVQGGARDAQARQAFARAQDVSACVFIDAEDAPGAAFALDYYYPHMRSPLCLHATLAAAQVLFERQGSAAPIAFRTALRGQTLTLSCEGDFRFVTLGRQAVDATRVPAPARIAELLAAPGLVLASAPALASVGSVKLLVEVADSATLQALRPDLARILAWGRENGVNGCYVYCRLGERVYEGRNFNHLDAALEDRATGVAAGALTALLGHALTLYQGGRQCLIRTRLDGERILVGGRVE